MRLNIFDVEHGACAILSDGYGKVSVIDCGHNATTGWLPGSYLRNQGITDVQGLIVTNYDEDHVSGIRNLFQQTNVHRIYRNMAVSPGLVRYLKSETGMGPGIDFLVSSAQQSSGYGTVGYADMGMHGIEFEVFHNLPSEFDDENNLSLALFVKGPGATFLFTGDLEYAGWDMLLRDPAFTERLLGVDVFFASHHGRESGCHPKVFEFCSPTFIVISDKAKGFQTQETTDWYAARARGGIVSWDPQNSRSVLTTRNDGNLCFYVGNGGFDVNRF